MQLAHDDVFQATSHQLVARAKDLGADEPGDVVQVNPGRRPVARLRHLLRERPREPVLARLVQHHVEAMAVAVGEIGALACLKVQTEAAASPGGVLHHLVDADVERGVGRVAAGDALKP